jgi:ubiquinol-cytochrome c reductase cytochrome b/c1 subunit
MMATGFLGYTLPWGQMSFWGAAVITSFFSSIDSIVPQLGTKIMTWLRGDFAVSGITLNRFFSLHYLLPFVIAGVVGLHIWALHVVGSNNPTGIPVRQETDTVPFRPYITLKDLFAIAIFSMVFAWFVFFAPNYLGHADNYIEANPLATPPHIVPEWYYLPFYAILRAIPNKLMGVAAMFGAIVVLFFVPWLDTSKIRSTKYRPLYKVFFWLLVISCFALGYLGGKPPEGMYVIMARIFTLYYFAHFLIIMPIIGIIETPKSMPASITEAVLGKVGAGAGAGRTVPASADKS